MASWTNKHDEEKRKLEQELSEFLDKKKAVFERTKEADQELLQIRTQERIVRERLQEIREEEQRERRAAYRGPENETGMMQELETLRKENAELRDHAAAGDGRMEHLLRENNTIKTKLTAYQKKQKQMEDLEEENAELKARASESARVVKDLREQVVAKQQLAVCQQKHGKMQDLQTENAELKVRVSESATLIECLLEEIDSTRKQLDDERVMGKGLESKTADQSTKLKQLKYAMQRMADYARTQEKEKEKLRGHVASLEDEISVIRKISAETQQRQLDEIQPPSRTLEDQKQQQTKETTSAAHADVLLYSKVSEKINAQTIARNMFQCNALTLKELQSIQSKHSQPVKSAEQLLNIVSNQSSVVYGSFLTALKETGQLHVYKLLVQGSYRGFDVTQTIQKHYVFLVDNTSAKHSGLVGELFQSGVLSSEEMESINAEMTSFAQNEKLLSVLSRKTKDQFDKFLDALDATGQRHVRNHITGRQEQERGDNGDAQQDDSVEVYQLMKQQLKQADETIATLLQPAQPSTDGKQSTGEPVAPSHPPPLSASEPSHSVDISKKLRADFCEGLGTSKSKSVST